MNLILFWDKPNTIKLVFAHIFLFVYICIVIVDPIIKKAEGGDSILLYTAWVWYIMNLILFWDKPNTIKLVFIERKIKQWWK
jgi:predicted membrane channel-forming protein YqfA (hemolysin III family)